MVWPCDPPLGGSVSMLIGAPPIRSSIHRCDIPPVLSFDVEHLHELEWFCVQLMHAQGERFGLVLYISSMSFLWNSFQGSCYSFGWKSCNLSNEDLKDSDIGWIPLGLSVMGLLGTWLLHASTSKATLSFPTLKVTIPFITLIKAPHVARKCLPRITGDSNSSSFMLITIESTDNGNLSTHTITSSTSPLECSISKL